MLYNEMDVECELLVHISQLYRKKQKTGGEQPWQSTKKQMIDPTLS